MDIRFWGTRGSLPTPMTASQMQDKAIALLKAADGRSFASDEELSAFIESQPFWTRSTYGGDTPCVEVVLEGEEHLIIDLGSGARRLGSEMLARFGPGAGQTYHVLMSHLHWDHLMGFPFFPPAYIPGNRIIVYGCHDAIEASFRRQHRGPNFPVDFSHLGANIEFRKLATGSTVSIAGADITPKLQLHAGDSYGYRIEAEGAAFVYSSDSEHRIEDEHAAEGFVDFFNDADLVVFDAMYSLADAVSVKEDWGHSSNIIGVELCQRAGARRLALFHHEPVYDDARIDAILADTRRYEEIRRDAYSEYQPLEVLAAYDGLVVSL